MMRALDCVSSNSFKITPTESTEVFAIDVSVAGSRRDLESQSTSNSSKSHSLWWHVFTDVPLLLCVITVVGLYELGIIPAHKGGFYCNDPGLSHKFNGETVDATTLMVTLLLTPVVAVFTTELLLLDSEYLVRSRTTEALWRTGLLYRTYAYGLAFNLLIVEAMKGIVGAPRPVFFDLCAPDTAVNCTTGEYITTFECTSSYSSWKQFDSYHSFPSGHTSMSVYCGLFIAWYLQRRAFSWSSRTVFLVPFLQLVCLCYAALCSLTRVTDLVHHWWDVAVGMAVGVLTSVFAVLVISKNFSSVCDKNKPSIQHSSANLLYDTSRRRPVS